ncbi:MAG: SDR family oxidoreductase [Chloroflexi bacterium]|nr:SDR family oxidoreductase [Chloroflexota bacterium]
MKLLFIGGTGIISSACSELAVQRGHELFILNRSISVKYPLLKGATHLKGDIHAGIPELSTLLAGHRFDAVVDFIAFTADDIERNISLFRGKTNQFVFISSASAYQKPPKHYLVTEETPLSNPFWQYSRDKIACEERLMRALREDGFPSTIVRPSLTYGPAQIPFCVGSWSHPWTVIDRMKRGQKVIIPGDGTSLWVLTWNADLAKGLVGLLGKRETIGEAFHITSDEVLSWNQIYLEAYQALGLEPNVIHLPSDFIARFDDHAVGSLIGDKSNSVVFDNGKIKRFVPDFRCEVNWAEGVRRALAWFETHPEFQTIDHEKNVLWDRMISVYGRVYS